MVSGDDHSRECGVVRWDHPVARGARTRRADPDSIRGRAACAARRVTSVEDLPEHVVEIVAEGGLAGPRHEVLRQLLPEGVLDAAFQPVLPNERAPELAPYVASWSLEAKSAGPLSLVATGRDHRRVARLEIRARDGGPSPRPSTEDSGELRLLAVDRPILLVEPPDFVFKPLRAVVGWFPGEWAITPHQLALGARSLFVLLAVLCALVLQRLVGWK